MGLQPPIPAVQLRLGNSQHGPAAARVLPRPRCVDRRGSHRARREGRSKDEGRRKAAGAATADSRSGAFWSSCVTATSDEGLGGREKPHALWLGRE